MKNFNYKNLKKKLFLITSIEEEDPRKGVVFWDGNCEKGINVLINKQEALFQVVNHINNDENNP